MKILFTLVLSLLSFQEAIACSCDMGSVEDKYESSYSIYAGEVEKIEKLGTSNAFGDENIVVYFRNTTLFKGNSIFILHTANNGAGCTGYWFKKQSEYLVYTFQRKDGKLDTMWCGGVISKSESPNEFKAELKQVSALAK